MPPLTMKFGNKWFADCGEEFKKSNNVIEITAWKIY